MRLCRLWPWPRRHRLRLVEFPDPSSHSPWMIEGYLCTRCGRLWIGDYKTMRNTWPRDFHPAAPSERHAFHNAKPHSVMQCGVGGLP